MVIDIGKAYKISELHFPRHFVSTTWICIMFSPVFTNQHYSRFSITWFQVGSVPVFIEL